MLIIQKLPRHLPCLIGRQWLARLFDVLARVLCSGLHRYGDSSDGGKTQLCLFRCGLGRDQPSQRAHHFIRQHCDHVVIAKQPLRILSSLCELFR
ncbi:MAG: hypothetical protein ACRDID_21195 [Ktedonobacterales bacterium]